MVFTWVLGFWTQSSFNKHFTHWAGSSAPKCLEKFFPTHAHLTTTANPKLFRGDNLYSVTETWVSWKAGQARVTGPGLMVPSLSSVPSLVEYPPVITGKQTNKKPKQQPKQQTPNTTTMDSIFFACTAWKIHVKGLKTGRLGCVPGVCITSLGISVASQQSFLSSPKSCYWSQAGLELTVLLFTSAGITGVLEGISHALSQLTELSAHISVTTLGSSTRLPCAQSSPQVPAWHYPQELLIWFL